MSRENPADARCDEANRKQLYERARETALLVSFVHRCWGHDENHGRESSGARMMETNGEANDAMSILPSCPHVGLVLISGSRGVGKRALVEVSLRSIQSESLLLSGQFHPNVLDSKDQQLDCSRIPVAVLSPFGVFQDALERITACVNSTTLERFRTVVALHFVEQSSDREILTKILPTTLVQALFLSPNLQNEVVTSTTPISPFADATSGPREHEQSAALARFIVVLSTCMPVVLHLEQIQWAHADSLQVIQILLRTDWDTASKTKGLAIVASCRQDTEMNREIQSLLVPDVHDADLKHRIQRIPLANLSQDSVEQWTTRQLSLAGSGEDTLPLANLVFGNTGGNPLHVQYLLIYLQATDRLRGINDKELEILRRELPSDIDSILNRILAHISVDLWDVVEISAALGDQASGSFDNQVLEMVLQRSCTVAVAELRKFEVLELDGDRLRFCRRELQTLAYSMIPESKRAAIHLKIGRRMWKNSTLGAENEMDEDERKLGLIAHQLFRGLHMVTDGEELKVIAVIHFRVGKQAMGASSFKSAVTHFEIAKTALGDKLWSPERYEISLMLCNCMAEALYCTGDFQAMENTLHDILRRASTFRDKLQAYTTFVFTNGARHRLNEAVTMALDVLKQLGEPISSNPSSLSVMFEYFRIRIRMRGKTDRYFLGLPAATDADKVAAMQMLNFACYYSFVVNPKIGAMAVFRMLRLTMLYGMTGPGSTAFSSYGVLSNSLGRMEESYRFGQIALNLLGRVDGKAWLPRVYFMVYGVINPSCCPLRDSLEPLQFAYQAALNTGDMEGSVIAAGTYSALSFHSGKCLAALEQDTISYCKAMEAKKQTMGLLFTLPLWQVLCSLSGTSELSLQLTGPVTDAESARVHAIKEGNRTAQSIHFGMAAVRGCYLGDFATALEMAQQSSDRMTEMDFHLSFYRGIAALALAWNEPRWSFRRRRYMSIGHTAAKQLQNWARICPSNMPNKQYLLEAELAALKGDSTKAMLLYNESIQTAGHEGFVHEQGLAYERLARHHVHLGHFHTVAPYFECARDVYRTWGANVLVRRMDEVLATLPPRPDGP